MNRKKLAIVGITCVMAISFSLPVFASSFTHSGDEWEKGCVTNAWQLIWGNWQQYSNFYCPVQKHHATAIIVDTNGTRYESRVTANAGAWAKACTGWACKVENASCYGHD